ncbi:putative uncharacterized protein DDB_G0286901 [Leptopilina boulardi]|uniref:putative uncharacterized protein DDB_G0286901 n=1 Tax=Leptopilina boulardi TaxID=63433 RepID=UPI0021F6627A|nr:putative uncharacterized protein DDB_G0286901 [Leptopilina boulardi]
MCHCILFLMFFLKIFFINYKYIFVIIISQQVMGEERNPRETVRQINQVSQDWMMEILNVNKELLDVHAVIAKDEESTTNCMMGTKKTNKRHLMCVGSIVNVQHVLTSATCIQEATYIRHNLKAPLVVVVGLLKPKPQVIRVNNYEVHPQHIAFPYNSQHSMHNIAVIKLACRIATEHFTPIELPRAPFTELCPNDNCMVAIIRKVGKTSNVIYDTWAKHIPPVTRGKRGLTETTIELQNNNNLKTPPVNIQEKLRETLVNPRPLKLNAEQDILSNNISQTTITKKLSKMTKSMAVKNNVKEKRNFSLQNVPEVSSTANVKNNNSVIDEYAIQGDSDRNDKVRLFSTRASDGFQGCPQSGSPVMFGKVQAALVSVSCDDRQPGTPWKYTDIFSNLDWIEKETDTWHNDTKSRADSSLGCTTCIYNFFIDLTGPNETDNCTDLNEFNDKSTNYKICASNYQQENMKNHYSRSISDNKLYNSLSEKFSKFYENTLKNKKSLDNQLNNKTRHNSDSTNKNSKNNFDADVTKANAKLPAKIFDTVVKNLKSKDFRKTIETFQKNNDYKNSKAKSKKLKKIIGNKNSQTNQKGFHNIENKNDYLGKKNFYRDDNKEKKLQLDSHREKIMNEPNKNENLLSKKHESKIDKTPMNAFDYSMIKKMINSQPSIDYNNPLVKKFHNLRMFLARLQKSTADKHQEIRQTPMIGKPIEILPYGRFFNPPIKIHEK